MGYESLTNQNIYTLLAGQNRMSIYAADVENSLVPSWKSRRVTILDPRSPGQARYTSAGQGRSINEERNSSLSIHSGARWPAGRPRAGGPSLLLRRPTAAS